LIAAMRRFLFDFPAARNKPPGGPQFERCTQQNGRETTIDPCAP
jgi:hypothetical protein